MFASLLARSLQKRHIHYGWIVVGVAFLTMLVTAGALGAPGVLMVPLQREFGWNASEISSALAIRFVLFGALAPFAAALLNHFGVRRMVIGALVMIALALLLSLGMTSLWQLVLYWGLLLGLATGVTALVLGATVATRWFVQRRGLAIGILSASSASGQLVFLPMLASVTDNYGWRITLAIVCVALLITAVLVLAFMSDRPSDLNLPAYGDTTVSSAPQTKGGLLSTLWEPITILGLAARTRTFWILFATFFICGASTNGLIQTHFVAMCGDMGIVPLRAASVLAAMGAFDFFGTVGSGWLSDRFDNRWLLFWYYGLRGLSLLFLPFTSFSFYALSLFAIFYGLDWLATVPPTVRLTVEKFGRERANIVFGWVFAGHQLGAAMAALGGGISRTHLATYLPAFFIAGALCLIAAALVLFITKNDARLTPRSATAAPTAA
jgi:predicted MFS family arabinose efflux permease